MCNIASWQFDNVIVNSANVCAIEWTVTNVFVFTAHNILLW